jgi:hypothetical protein
MRRRAGTRHQHHHHAAGRAPRDASGSPRSWKRSEAVGSRTNLYASVIVPELPCLCMCVRVQSGGAAVEQMARDIFVNRPAA